MFPPLAARGLSVSPLPLPSLPFAPLERRATEGKGVEWDLIFISKGATILFKSIPPSNLLSNHVRTGE